jgi:RND family efflux transporter MFP subunit
MSMKRVTISITIALLALLATACGGHDSEPALADLLPVTAALAAVERVTDAAEIEVYGIVQPARQSFVSSRVMGPVVAIHVRAGDRVNKDGLLLEIAPESIDGQVAQAMGAKAQAEAALALAEKNLRRFESLFEDNAASELELDMARMQYEQAQGAVGQAEGAVQAAGAVAEESGVRAPFPARVIEKLVDLGDLAAPGRPLVRLESLAGRQIWLTVREADIQRLKAGDEIEVSLDSLPAAGRITGRVDELIPAADPATHTFTVKVGLGKADVPSGASGRGYLPGDDVERLLIPASAVHERGGLELVVIRGEDGLARTRAVTTGAPMQDGRIEVLSGLAEGEQVLVDAAGPLPDGTPVEVR